MMDPHDIVANLELALVLIVFHLGALVAVVIAIILGIDENMVVFLAMAGVGGAIATCLYLKWVGKPTSNDRETD